MTAPLPLRAPCRCDVAQPSCTGTIRALHARGQRVDAAHRTSWPAWLAPSPPPWARRADQLRRVRRGDGGDAPSSTFPPFASQRHPAAAAECRPSATTRTRSRAAPSTRRLPLERLGHRRCTVRHDHLDAEGAKYAGGARLPRTAAPRCRHWPTVQTPRAWLFRARRLRQAVKPARRQGGTSSRGAHPRVDEPCATSQPTYLITAVPAAPSLATR